MTKAESFFPKLEEIYHIVEEAAEELGRSHGERLRCSRGCCSCCVDEITVFEVEALFIRSRCADLLREGAPHPEGACAFLDSQGDCRIYDSRPYVCRTQGLPLRWIDETPDGDIVEMRDICPLNDPGPPVEELPEEACWTIGPVEELLARLQAALDGGKLQRVCLRTLFARQE